MTPFYQDEWLTVLEGDVRARLRDLPDESVHCVVTSPPYWALRDYGTATWEGGDPACDHRAPFQPRAERPMGKLHGGFATVDAQDAGARARGACRRCGARRVDEQLGVEPTPELYVEHMVDVFREVRRVLRSDGTVWLNLGDSYASHDPGGYREGEFLNPGGRPPAKGQARNRAGTYRPDGLKAKDLVGIPWRVAFALQADGWYLRRDIIWAKPNPMPESVTDRPTSAHEYLFLLAKDRRYFFDMDAVREAALSSIEARWDPGTNGLAGDDRRTGRSTRRFSAKPPAGWNDGATVDDRVGRYKTAVDPHAGGRRQAPESGEAAAFSTLPNGGLGRNIRSVWTIATEPYPGAHFATFPRKLVEPCIKAGTSERGVCPSCGAPWIRIVERVPSIPTRLSYSGADAEAVPRHRGLPERPGGYLGGSATTSGWRPSCRHGGEPDDYELIRTPVGEGQGGAFYRQTHGLEPGSTARRGLDRERRDDEGSRPMYRWEQRAFARQLRAFDESERVARDDAIAAGYSDDAFAHWIRTDRSGARPIPPDLLERWIDRGWLVWPIEEVAAEEPVPATVLDPFAGSGTTGLVAQSLGRRAVLIDLNAAYLVQALERNRQIPMWLPTPVAAQAPIERTETLALFEEEEAVNG